jgi:hypothetical protein
VIIVINHINLHSKSVVLHPLESRSDNKRGATNTSKELRRQRLEVGSREGSSLLQLLLFMFCLELYHPTAVCLRALNFHRVVGWKGQFASHSTYLSSSSISLKIGDRGAYYSYCDTEEK